MEIKIQIRSQGLLRTKISRDARDVTNSFSNKSQRDQIITQKRTNTREDMWKNIKEIRIKKNETKGWPVEEIYALSKQVRTK